MTVKCEMRQYGDYATKGIVEDYDDFNDALGCCKTSKVSLLIIYNGKDKGVHCIVPTRSPIGLRDDFHVSKDVEVTADIVEKCYKRQPSSRRILFNKIHDVADFPTRKAYDEMLNDDYHLESYIFSDLLRLADPQDYLDGLKKYIKEQSEVAK